MRATLHLRTWCVPVVMIVEIQTVFNLTMLVLCVLVVLTMLNWCVLVVKMHRRALICRNIVTSS